MKNKSFIIILIIVVFVLVSCIYLEKIENNRYIEATITAINDEYTTLKDANNKVYYLALPNTDFHIGNQLKIQYKGSLQEKTYDANIQIISCEQIPKTYTSPIPDAWQDDGIFSDYYDEAYQKLETLSIEEKIGQLLLVRYSESDSSNMLKNYHIGGFVFYAKDIENKNQEEVIQMINNLNSDTTIPLLTAIDEEGGKVSRLSTNPNLVTEKFKSSSELYNNGGFEAIKNDTLTKSELLTKLGFNLNFAPVVDVSTDPNDYIYERTLKEDYPLVAQYAQTVIEASKDTNVSYTLKHFPGYGNSKDTHNNTAINYESYETIQNTYLPPFISGINSGAEAVMISHNIMNSIDNINPASLSTKIHTILKDDLKFTGITITDDLAMGAVSKILDVETKAILAGNDLLITSDYKKSFDSIKKSIDNNTISIEQLNHNVFKILAWKYYKKLI